MFFIIIVWTVFIGSVREREEMQEDDVVLVIAQGCYFPEREGCFERIGAGHGRRS